MQRGLVGSEMCIRDRTNEDIREYSVEELASYLIDNPNSLTQSALFRAIREEKNHFKRKGLLVTPRTNEQIDEILTQEKKEKEKQEIYSIYSDNINLAMRTDPTTNPKIFDYLFSWLKEPDNQIITSVIEKYANGQDNRFFVYNILKSNNIISQELDKFAIIYGIATEFSQELIQEVEHLEIDITGREDISHLTSYTIDSEDTKEIDDAISFDVLGENYLVGVHITDLGSYILKDSLLDQEAARRVSTIYLETGEIPMFPPELCHNKLSLVKGQIRPCLSALFTFSSEFELLEKRIILSKISVTHKISYDELDKILKKSKNEVNSDFNILKKLTDFLRNRRFEAGAIEINRPEIEIRVVDDKINLKTTNQRSYSRKIISELMILMNTTVAEFASVNNIPYIYKIQEMPSEDYKHFLQPDYYDPIMNDKLIRLIRPSNYSSFPGKHYGLGVDFYSQISSPLRRYFDLLSQRQITSFLNEQNFIYTQEELLSFISDIDLKKQKLFSALQQLIQLLVLKVSKRKLSLRTLTCGCSQ
eukprot:TRINITY_DN30318_c0_g1_i5.p1 TRINITY_DN30318_c0_g1~~TRINITY_DN30318_c0_g1_i5.p1  ORF type:complete len:533 (+),score=48.59 TRINITY_DN30318_c0_g1_i5:117-1715(+)